MTYWVVVFGFLRSIMLLWKFTLICIIVFFFFKQKTAYDMRISDWSSDVCSSDLRAHDVAARYACERMAFGKPLIDHEGVGFMLADNLIDLKSAELLTDWCADILDAGGRGSQESSMAKEIGRAHV